MIVICVASGPSLTKEDCETAQGSGHKIIAVNNSWRMVEADVLYASDYAWWKRYASELTTKAQRWSNSRKAQVDYGCQQFRKAMGCNSGLAAIYLAHELGASWILLLGYDCQPKDGKLHWHGAHKRCNNPNEISFRMWHKQFRQTHGYIKAKTMNCSADTALTCFTRMTLADALKDSGLRQSGASSQSEIARLPTQQDTLCGAL